MASDGTSENLDYAIVGGGISGVYSGWRLLTSKRTRSGPGDPAGGPPRVEVFEMSDRIGGRLLSVTPPGISKGHVELGGMRISSSQKWVNKLIDHLGIKTEEFPVHEPQNLAYLRRRVLRNADLSDPQKIPYDLRPDEATPCNMYLGFTAVAALRMLEQVKINGKPIEPVDLQDVDWKKVGQEGTFEGTHLYDLPFRYMLGRMLSHEAYQFNHDVSGYDSIFHTWNAADGFPWNLADFGAHSTFSRIKKGFERVPAKVKKRFVKAGGKIHFHHELRSFEEVRLADGAKGIELRFECGKERRTVRARHLILAMPRRSLELLDETGPVLSRKLTDVRKLIESVTPIPLFKLAICYPEAWWQKLDPIAVEDGKKWALKRITRGESVTDLPIRQCYYWAVDEKSGKAVILIYDGGQDRDYWAALRQDADLFENDLRLCGRQQAENWRDHPAPKRMVEEIHRQLRLTHGKAAEDDVPRPYAAAYRDWGEDPFGGGANFWNVHVKSYDVQDAIIQPVKGLPVYICGEAYSHGQGWVEGALETAELMLQNHLGLEEPYQEE